MAATTPALIGLSLICALCSGVVSIATIGLFRYPDWAITSRYASESSALTLPVLAIVTALLSRHVLRSRLPWLSPHLPRARRLAQRTAFAFAAGAVLGFLVGLVPLFGWGVARATYGQPSILGLLASLVWIVAIVLLVVLCTALFRSVWPGLIIAVLLVGCFYWGYSRDTPYGRFSTHLSFLPFDGQRILLGAGGVEVNLRLELIRLSAGLALATAAAVGIGRVFGVETLTARLRRVLATPVTGAVLALFIGASIPSVPVTAARTQPLRCRDDGGLQVCLLASHATDLTVATQAAVRISRAAGARLLPARRVVEGTARSAPVDSSQVLITLSPESGIDPAADAAQQISTYVAHLDTCFTGRGHTADNLAAATVIADWFARQGRSSRVTNPSSDSMIKKWSSDPAAANDAFRARAEQIARCSLTSRDLP